MKKILFLTRTLGLGGIPLSLMTYLNTFEEGECDITVGLITDSARLRDQMPSWIKVISIIDYQTNFDKKMIKHNAKLKEKKLKFLWKLSNQLLKILEIKQVRRAFKEKYDVANAFHQGICSDYVINNIKADKKYLWLHTSFLTNDCKERVFKKADKIILVNPLVSEVIKNEWKKVKASAIDSVPCLLDYKKIRNKSKEKENSILFNKPTFCTVCRLSFEKGLDIITDAAEILINKQYDFQWLIVGDGYLRDELIKNIRLKHLENYVLVLGEKENPYPYILNADVYVSTSTLECYGVTIGEAKLLGKAMVGTKTFASRYHIKNDYNGLICEIDASDLANKLSYLLDNQNKVIEYSNNSKRFDFETENKNIISHLKEIEL